MLDVKTAGLDCILGLERGRKEREGNDQVLDREIYRETFRRPNGVVKSSTHGLPANIPEAPRAVQQSCWPGSNSFSPRARFMAVTRTLLSVATCCCHWRTRVSVLLPKRELLLVWNCSWHACSVEARPSGSPRGCGSGVPMMRAYLKGGDPPGASRTWHHNPDEILRAKKEAIERATMNSSGQKRRCSRESSSSV